MNDLPATRPRVIHFVTGGGSGATKVALDLACGHLRRGNFSPLLVLRRKRAPLPEPMQRQIELTGLPSAWVDSGSKRRTLRQLAALIEKFKPVILVAHGNSEHLWGRQAALAARVPVVVHVEHCNERYVFWRRWTARRLAKDTTATICVSPGVAVYAAKLGVASARTEVILNGVDFPRYAAAAASLSQRGLDIVMAARFARQKDQATLIRAVARLVGDGWAGRLLLCGAGNLYRQKKCRRLALSLGIASRVDFLGLVNDMAPIYHRCRTAVLSTRYEGLPLALIESMAAGCASIGSRVPGVVDVITHQKNGWLFPAEDDAALAETLRQVLAGGPAIEAVADRGQHDARTRFSLDGQIARYESLFDDLLARSSEHHPVPSC